MVQLRCGTLLAIAFLLIGCSGSEAVPAPSREARSTAPAQMARTAKSIRVESQIVKQVGGKHRYFFDIRNRDEISFNGSVTITLLGDTGPLARETFSATRPIEPGLGTSVYVEANTGPVSVHGSFGIKIFQFEVTDGGAVVSSGTGSITDKLESL
jgi:hypothetical protein